MADARAWIEVEFERLVFGPGLAGKASNSLRRASVGRGGVLSGADDNC